MKKILCLSFWTPPIIRPQSILIGKMIPEWIRQGEEPIIISYDCGDWDIEAKQYTIPKNKSDIFQRFVLYRKYRRKKYFEKIYNICKDIVEKNEINTIFSFSKPMESNIIGAMLKERLGIKFISHFCDPWYDNPYSSKRRKQILKEETYIIKHSDRIIFTNDIQRDLVLKKYPEKYGQKAHVIPHCFDSNLYPKTSKKNIKFTFSYIGAFYKERNPEFFFQALSQALKTKRISAPVTVKLIGAINEYAGYTNRAISETIKHYALEEIVEIIDSVSYIESLKYMSNSDCLIAIDANFKNSPFLPSKLIDYAGSQNPIIAITPAGSPTESFVNKLDCRSFTYGQETELTDFLIGLITESKKTKIAPEKIQEFCVKNTTKNLLKIFNEI